MRRDLACVVAVTALAAVLARVRRQRTGLPLTRRVERFQLDELPATLFVLATVLRGLRGGAIGSRSRSWRGGARWRKKAERLLADNRRLAMQALEAQEAERRHLARELHDELGQYLNAIALDAGRIRDLSAQREPEIHRLSLALMQSASHVYRRDRRDDPAAAAHRPR